MTIIDDMTIPDPAMLIQHAAFRSDVDRLIAETVAPPDCMIVAVAERHFGELTDADRQASIELVRNYSAAMLAARERA